MRFPDDSVFGRRSRPADFRRNYFLAFEGLTEYQYFSGIKRNREKLGIGGTVDIQLMLRFDQDVGESDPRNILGRMEEYRLLISEGIYSVSLFAGTMTQSVYDAVCQNCPRQRKKACVQRIRLLQKEMENALKGSDCVDGDVVRQSHFDEATDICRKLIKGMFPRISDSIPAPPDRKLDTYSEDTDVFCLIVDRDEKSRPNRYYRSLIGECEKGGIALYLSNPSIEFWFLLHFERVTELSESELEDLRRNAKRDGDGRAYAEVLLDGVTGGYSKSHIEFERNYLDRVDHAVETAESFETDLTGLADNLGTNVGRLLKRIRENS